MDKIRLEPQQIINTLPHFEFAFLDSFTDHMKKYLKIDFLNFSERLKRDAHLGREGVGKLVATKKLAISVIGQGLQSSNNC